MPYFSHRRVQRGNFTPSPWSASARKFSHPQPRRVVQNSTNARLPSGSMLFDTMKSSMDWISPMAGMVTPDSTLKPSAHGMDSTSTSTALKITARLRIIPHLSMDQLIRFSNTAMTVDSDANAMNTKNRQPHTLPSGICPNTTGSVTNTSDGP